MTKRFYLGILCVAIFLVTGCSKPIDISEEEFNGKVWKNDRKACSGERLKMKENFEGIKHKLLGLDEKGILKVLGKPDYVDLTNRNSKYYIYYLEAGNQCENIKDAPRKGGHYRLRFTPINLVKEVSFHKGI